MICRIGGAWACVQDIFSSSEELEGYVQFQRVSSSLSFNSCTEAKFVALVQLSLARLSELFTKIIAFLIAVFYLSVSWKLAYQSQFCHLAVIAVAVPVCSQCTKGAGQISEFSLKTLYFIPFSIFRNHWVLLKNQTSVCTLAFGSLWNKQCTVRCVSWNFPGHTFVA